MCARLRCTVKSDSEFMLYASFEISGSTPFTWNSLYGRQMVVCNPQGDPSRLIIMIGGIVVWLCV